MLDGGIIGRMFQYGNGRPHIDAVASISILNGRPREVLQ